MQPIVTFLPHKKIKIIFQACHNYLTFPEKSIIMGGRAGESGRRKRTYIDI